MSGTTMVSQPTEVSDLVEYPFVVSGTLHGRPVEVAVSCPAEVLRIVTDWCAEDENACGTWMLRADQPEPVLVIARQVTGLVRETRRVAHLFQIEPGVVLRCHLRSTCGQEISLLDLEWLSVGSGMPCVDCLGEQQLAAIPA